MTPERLQTKNPSRLLLRLPVPWVFVLGYLLGAGLQYLVPIAFSLPSSRSVLIGGAALFAAGALVAGWAWAIFHRAGTTRVPGQSSTTLVTSGPYRVSRNPMYVGLALAFLGEAAMLRQIWPVVLLPLVLAYLNWTVIPLEEERLREVFQRSYDDYRRRVRRWI